MKEANHKHNSYSYHKLVIHNGFAGIYLYAVYATRQSQLFIHIFFFSYCKIMTIVPVTIIEIF